MNELNINARLYSISTLNKLCKVCCHAYKLVNQYKICQECWDGKGYKELIEKQIKKQIK